MAAATRATPYGGSVHSHDTGSGIIARQVGNVELGGTDVSANLFTGVAVTMGSTAAIYDSTVNGNTVVDGNWADDQIECRGKEASMEIGPDAYVSTWTCIDPEF